MTKAMPTSLLDLTLVQAKKGLTKGHFSSLELVSALLEQSKQVNPLLCAFTEQHSEEVMKLARTADQRRAAGDTSALLGLPFSIKENIKVKGYKNTLGIKKRAQIQSNENAMIVDIIESMGGMVLGTTNVPQTLLAMETSNFVYGTTNNPWNTTRTAGGSSGGEAAAIASRQSLAGIGTDVGGSIRTPAAFCGVAGFKPTLHRWSNQGSVGVFFGQEFARSQMGPMAKTAEDLAFIMRTINSETFRAYDPYVPPLPYSKKKLKPLTVGICLDDGYLTPSPSVQRALKLAERILNDAGIKTVPHQPVRGKEDYAFYVAGLSAAGKGPLTDALADEPLIDGIKMNVKLASLPDRIRKVLAKTLSLSGQKRLAEVLWTMGEKSVHQYWQLTHKRNQWMLEEQTAWQKAGIDMLLAPAQLMGAPAHGGTRDFTVATACLSRYNLLQLPAGVVPVTRVRAGEDDVKRAPHPTHGNDKLEQRATELSKGADGLPIGVQLIGRPYEDEGVLEAMQLIQETAMQDSEYPHLDQILLGSQKA